MYSSTLSLTSALDGVGGQRHTPAALAPRKGNGTHCTGGWVGPTAGLDKCGKFYLYEIRSPDRPSRSESLFRLSYPGPQYCVMWRTKYAVTAILRRTPDR